MLEPVDLLSRGFRLSSLGANCCIARKARKRFVTNFFLFLNAGETLFSARFIGMKCYCCHLMCVRHKVGRTQHSEMQPLIQRVMDASPWKACGGRQNKLIHSPP